MEDALTLSGETSSTDYVLDVAHGYAANPTSLLSFTMTVTYEPPTCDCTHLVFIPEARRSDLTVEPGSTTTVILNDPRNLADESSTSPDFQACYPTPGCDVTGTWDVSEFRYIVDGASASETAPSWAAFSSTGGFSFTFTPTVAEAGQVLQINGEWDPALSAIPDVVITDLIKITVAT